MSGLVVVSAVYLLREHGLNTRERRLRKELTNSQAEISKLIMKVNLELQCAHVPSCSAVAHSLHPELMAVIVALQIVSMQHSMQSPGRVPIIRHTCTMSTVTPFPLMHLV